MNRKINQEIIEAVFRSDADAVLQLARKFPELVDQTDGDGRSALAHAAIDRNAEIASVLLSAGADPNRKDRLGNTPLHYATQEYAGGVALALLDAGAEVDSQDANGNTPLSNAVFYSQGRGDLIRLLLDRGAQKEMKNAHGVSPIELARGIGNFDVTGFFE